jgi:hypothetical protein
VNPVLALGIVWMLSQHGKGAGAGAGNLKDQKTGPEALANLQAQKVAMTQEQTRSKTQTAFPSEWWTGPAPDKSGSVIYLVWASDEPSSWAVYAVHKLPTLPTEIARGKGAQTNAVASALSRRVIT